MASSHPFVAITFAPFYPLVKASCWIWVAMAAQSWCCEGDSPSDVVGVDKGMPWGGCGGRQGGVGFHGAIGIMWDPSSSMSWTTISCNNQCLLLWVLYTHNIGCKGDARNLLGNTSKSWSDYIVRWSQQRWGIGTKHFMPLLDRWELDS